MHSNINFYGNKKANKKTTHLFSLVSIGLGRQYKYKLINKQKFFKIVKTKLKKNKIKYVIYF